MTPSLLLFNLALALGVALVGGVIALRLGQSVILGYTLAGIVIGPYTPGFVGDPATVDALANVGVILLMFTIGVRISFRDLLQAGTLATIGGGIQILLTIGVGYLAGTALGWGLVEALFFGAVISNSSSTVLSKVVGERGEAGAEHSRLALAWSTVQDLSTIVLVVVLSVLSTGEALVPELLWATGKAVLFLILLLPIGGWVFPRLFERVLLLRSREIFIILVAVVALGTAFLSAIFGLSLALGAFVAGVVVGESEMSDQILGEVTPLRDIFAGLFFVSVGMFVNPGFIVQNIPLVLVGIALIVLFKGTLSAVIALLFRLPVRTAVLTGVLLAQSAEFSFLLAQVGASLNAVSATTFNLMLASAVASIVLAPSLYRLAAPGARWLEDRLPASPLATHADLTSETQAPRRHAILCGYGDVGSMIGSALQRRGFRFVVIEQEPRIVRQLREEGILAVLGNADNPSVLDLVNVAQARILIITIPDAFAARLIVQHARRLNPRLAIVVRTHSEDERLYLETLGVGEAVVGEREVSLEMTRYTLQRFGVTAQEAQATVRRLRLQVQRRPGDRVPDPGHQPWVDDEAWD